jgi:hypothetical protein
MRTDLTNSKEMKDCIFGKNLDTLLCVCYTGCGNPATKEVETMRYTVMLVLATPQPRAYRGVVNVGCGASIHR